MMRAAVLGGGQMVLRENVPAPTPDPGQVLVPVKACGICGYDLHVAKHGDEEVAADEQMPGAPRLTARVDLDRDVFMGHGFAAEVLEAGPGTETFQSGTIVTSMPALVSPEGLETSSVATARWVAMPSGCCCPRRCGCPCPTAWTRAPP